MAIGGRQNCGHSALLSRQSFNPRVSHRPSSWSCARPTIKRCIRSQHINEVKVRVALPWRGASSSNINPQVPGEEQCQPQGNTGPGLEYENSEAPAFAEYPPSATIVGGGPAGALAAIMLAKQGWFVNVYEARQRTPSSGGSGSGWETDPCSVSWNVSLSHRAFEALRSIDALDEVQNKGVKLLGRVEILSGGKRRFLPSSCDLISVSVSDLADALISLAQKRYSRQIRFFFGHRCTSVDFRVNCAMFVNNSSSYSDRQVASAVTVKKSPPADLLIGADGVNSVVRLGMQTQAPMFGFSQEFDESLVYRAAHVHLLPSALAPDRRKVVMGGRNGKNQGLVLADAIYDFGTRRLGSASAGCILLPNSDRSYAMILGGPPAVACQNAEDFKVLLSTAFPEVLEILDPDALHALAISTYGASRTVTCSRFHHHRAILLGDAAHAMFNTLGQGVNSAFEDCLLLERCLQKCKGVHTDVVLCKALEELSASRKYETDIAAELSRVALPRQPLESLRYFLTYKTLLLASSIIPAAQPWQLAMLTSSEDYSSIVRRRSREGFLVFTILASLGAVVGAVGYYLWLELGGWLEHELSDALKDLPVGSFLSSGAGLRELQETSGQVLEAARSLWDQCQVLLADGHLLEHVKHALSTLAQGIGMP